MARETPRQWAALMEAVDIHSIRQLADKAKVPHLTVTKAVHGDVKRPSEATIIALAKALRRPPAEIFQLVGVDSPGVGTPWEAPSESVHLNREQREVLTQLVKTMARGNLAPAGVTSEAQVVELGSRRRPEDRAAHPELDTPGSRRRAADKTRGEESQETGYDD